MTVQQTKTQTDTRNQPQVKEIPHHLNQPNEIIFNHALRSNPLTLFSASLLHFQSATTDQAEQIFRTRSRDTTYFSSDLPTNEKPDTYTKPNYKALPLSKFITSLLPLFEQVFCPIVLFLLLFNSKPIYHRVFKHKPHITNLFSLKP
jgi:hypothetical protein